MAEDDLDKYDENVKEDIQHYLGRAGGETNPEVTPHEDTDRDPDDLSGLPDYVAEDIRHAAGGAPGP